MCGAVRPVPASVMALGGAGRRGSGPDRAPRFNLHGVPHRARPNPTAAASAVFRRAKIVNPQDCQDLNNTVNIHRMIPAGRKALS